MRYRTLFPLLAALALAGCETDDDLLGPGPVTGSPSIGAPESVLAESQWTLEGWDGLDPVGHPEVEVSWFAPAGWSGEAFRVYGKRSGDANYFRIATVTACTLDGFCVYDDPNVREGQSYDYFVATLDEFDREVESSAVRVSVPTTSRPETPAAARAVALDGAVYLQWPSTGAALYQVFLESVDDEDTFVLVGETDGTGFLDERAENGSVYGYRIAAVGEQGRFSRRSPLSFAVPRPDYHADVIRALEDDPAGSGFRFVRSEDQVPIVDGQGAQAQWRLAAVSGTLSIVPLGDTRVSTGTFTTALTCGPASEADCVAVDRAPADSQLGAEPVAVRAGHTYVFRVTGDDGRTHYGKIRVQGSGADAEGDRYVVFDWAYQLIPGEPSLVRND